MKRQFLSVTCLSALLVTLTGPLHAQTTTDAAKADGKAFGRDKAASAQSAATTNPNANRIPNFGGTPSQSGYFDDPDRMSREAASQTTTNTGYKAMRDSMDRRARFAPQDLDATIARSNVISDDPLAYTSGMAIGGSQGRCVPLPQASGTAARYMATCNVGYTATQETRTCPVTLTARVEQRQVYGYYCVGGSGVDPASVYNCRGQRSSTTAQGAGKYDDVNPGVPRNYTWTILKKSAFFSPGGRFDEELAEYAMTLLGTIIYVPPKDDEPGKFVPIVGEASSTLVTSLLDGTTNGNVLIFDCDETEKCLNPGFKSLSLPASKALRPRVAALIGGMVQAIRDDTAISEEQKELLQVASIPLYKILTVQAAYGRGMPTDDRETLAEIASVDLLFAVLDRIVSEAGRSMSSFIGADEAKIAMWQNQVNVVRQALADRQANTHLKVNAVLQIIEKTAFIENVLAASMSPGMAASLDWSRGVQSRALTH